MERTVNRSALIIQVLIALVLLAIALGMTIVFFERLPIEGTSLGIDWKTGWSGVEGGQLHYGTGLRNPPWGLILTLPLGLLSFRASWGVLTLITIVVLVISVPNARPKWRWAIAIVLLVTSFPSLRHLIDGNIEAMVIGGTLLIVYGFSQSNIWALGIGILLTSAKPQEVWVFLIVIAISVLRQWPKQKWIALGLLLSAVIGLSLLWKGREWWGEMVGIPERGTLVDSSLSAAFGRAGLPFWLLAIVWCLLLGISIYIALRSKASVSRESATLLIAASMLLAPYTAGNSFLTCVALGIVPLFIVRPKIGIALFILTDLPFLATQEMRYWWGAYYWTAMLLVVWIAYAWQIWQTNKKPRIGAINRLEIQKVENERQLT